MIDNSDISNSTLQMLAFEALKNWETSSIIHLLSDKDYIVRTLAARELQTRGEQSAFEAAIKLTKSQVIYEREISAFLLGQLGTPNAPFKDDSLPVLQSLTFDESEDVISAAVAGIGHLCFGGMPENVEAALFELAKSNSSEVRKCVAYALGRASNQNEALNVLNDLINDANEDVREYAVLGKDILTAE